MMRHVLNLGLRLFLVCTVAAAGLGLTYTLVKDRIAQEEVKRQAKAAEVVLSSINAQPRENEEFTTLLQPEFPDLITVFEGLDEDGRRMGYAFVLKSKGYNFIILAIGVDVEGKVTGIKAVTNEETPGLGSVALDSREYLAKFEGKGPEPLTLKVDVDAWTGATYTSKGITNGVNTALRMWKALREGGEG